MAEVASIQYDRMIMEKKKQKEISEVENQAHKARIISQADADYYLIQKQAESNKVQLHVLLCVDTGSTMYLAGQLGLVLFTSTNLAIPVSSYIATEKINSNTPLILGSRYLQYQAKI